MSEFNFVIQKMMRDDAECIEAFNWLIDTKPEEESSKWLSLVYLMAIRFPHADDPPMVGGIPGKNTSLRALKMIIGRRGLVHGWGGDVPKIEQYITNLFPRRWAPENDSDGNSSYRSDSPYYDGLDTSDDVSGPRGVVRRHLPVTGLTSVSETSSSLSDVEDFVPNSRLNVYRQRVPEHKKLQYKRFDHYVVISNRERRIRREARRARRLLRLQYDQQRRLNEPAYNLEAKRAEILSSKSVRDKYKALETLDNERRAKIRLKRKMNRAEYRRRRSELQTENSSDTPHVVEFENIGKSLIAEVSRTWRLFYGSQNAGDLSLDCWLSPVEWVQQTGPNCGLAVLAMASRPLMKNENISVEPFSLADFQYEALRTGISGRGEIFSARILAKLAKSFLVGQYNIKLKNNDLLDSVRNTNRRPLNEGYTDFESDDDDEENVTDIKHTSKDTKQRQPKIGNRFPDGNVIASDSWALSLVQQLVSGKLVAVCFDCDKNMMPCSTSGGTKAHWALLCGVIVGKIDDSPQLGSLNETCLKQDHVWVIARHGKNTGNYAVWSLRELANSNRQLRTPGEHILRSVPSEVREKWEQKLKTNRPLYFDYRVDIKSSAHGHTANPKVEPFENIEDEEAYFKENLVLNERNDIPDYYYSLPKPNSPEPSSYAQRIPVTRLEYECNSGDEPPFVLPEGPQLDQCLARQYVVFDPVLQPLLLSSDDDFVSQAPFMHSCCPLLFHFKFNGTL